MTYPTWPAASVEAVTPSDVTNFSVEVRQLYVGTGGDVVVVNNDDSTCTFTNVLSGSYLGPFFIKRVNFTGTSASDMVAFV